MNGIEKITAKLAADCDVELELFRAETAEKCRAVKEAGDKAAQEAYWNEVRAGVKECEQRVSHLSRTAQMEARKSVLALKQEMVSEAFVRAHEMLIDLPEAQYVAFLGRKAAEASSFGQEQLLFSERDLRSGAGKKIAAEANRQLAARGMDGMLSVGSEPRDITGGFVLKQGDIEVNCSMELLTQQWRSELAAQVAEILFGD